MVRTVGFRDIPTFRAFLRGIAGINSHDRDRNASYNILRVGASTLGLGDVRPALQAVSA